jgi:hypothetical protein
MKRMLLSTVTASVLALAAPGMASAAQSSKSHHRAHHSRTHSRHHVVARPRVLTFGKAAASTRVAGSPTGSPGTPGTPTPPADGSGETAGTVLSFTNGVLTITLTNGTTVSGQVTEKTEVHCQPATPPSTSGEDQGEDESAQGEGSGSGDTQHMRSDGQQPGSGQQGTEGDGGSGSDGQGSGDGRQTCTTAALVPGAVVREAELSVEGPSAVWDHIDLVQ